MKVNLKEMLDDRANAHHWLLRCLFNSKNLDETIPFDGNGAKNLNVDITMQVDGVEVQDPVAFFKHAEKCFEECVAEEAAKKVQESLQKVDEMAHNFSESLQEVSKQIVAKHLGDGFFVCSCGTIRSKDSSYCHECG